MGLTLPCVSVVALPAHEVHGPVARSGLYVLKAHCVHNFDASTPVYPGLHMHDEGPTLPVADVLACCAHDKQVPLGGTVLYLPNGHWLHVPPTETQTQSSGAVLAVDVVLVPAAQCVQLTLLASALLHKGDTPFQTPMARKA